jgi:SOS-response transcriptional repressor LexA
VKKNTLSQQQQKIYDFIGGYHRENGIAPTIVEIADSLGLARTTVKTYVDILKNKGYVAGKHGIPRSLRIVPEPVLS